MSKNAYPTYMGLLDSGELQQKAGLALQQLRHCTLCGWHCKIDRAVELGPCRTGLEVLVATAYVHHGEERPLVRGGGSGAIFFSNCDLRCQFCQTSRWNIKGQGTVLTSKQLADVMLMLQEQGAVNINLVTPTHVAPQIIEALSIAVETGFRLPLVWNSGGYDSLDILTLLDGIVDIYLPDMKYSDPLMALRMSGVRDYPHTNQVALSEMLRQVGHLKLNEQGQAVRGLLVRHLIMPGNAENTRGVLEWIAKNLGPETYLSLMDQYQPAYRAFARGDIGRAILLEEFEQARDSAIQLGLTRLDDHLLMSNAKEDMSHG